MRTYYIWYDNTAQMPRASSRDPLPRGLAADCSTVRATSIGQAHRIAERRFNREAVADILMRDGTHPHDAAEIVGLD